MQEWFFINFTQIVGIFLSAFFVYVALIIIVRVNGLRSFSKISGHDFAITVAIGSLVATVVVSKDPAVFQAIIAIAALLIWQTVISLIRQRFGLQVFENKPCLVMKDGEVLEENLKRTNFTLDDLYAKLREANVLNLQQVRAAVVESTGDFSVLHGDAEEYDEEMLRGVSKDP